jgi:hypothetical protein
MFRSLFMLDLELGTHDLAELENSGIRDGAQSGEPLPFCGDHSGLFEDGEMFGDICLTRACCFDKLSDVFFTLHEGAEKLETHWFRQSAEAMRDEFQRCIGQLLRGWFVLGWGFLGHDLLWTLTLYHYIAI